jgi:fimbrial chaperone protein
MKITRLALLYAGATLLSTFPFAAINAKSQLQVRPTMLEMPVGAAAGRMTLANTGDEPVAAQVRVYAWVQNNGDEQLVPTSAMVLSPPIVEIPAGGEQIVRFVRQGPPPHGTDLVYRVVVDELPGKELNKKAAIGILVRYVLPLFVRDATASAPSLTCRVNDVVGSSKPLTGKPLTGKPLTGKPLTGKTDSENSAAFLQCSNSGGQPAQLGASRLLGPSHTHVSSYELTAGLLGYVLPGSTRRWPLMRSRVTALGLPMQFESRLNGALITIPISSN